MPSFRLLRRLFVAMGVVAEQETHHCFQDGEFVLKTTGSMPLAVVGARLFVIGLVLFYAGMRTALLLNMRSHPSHFILVYISVIGCFLSYGLAINLMSRLTIDNLITAAILNTTQETNVRREVHRVVVGCMLALFGSSMIFIAADMHGVYRDVQATEARWFSYGPAYLLTLLSVAAHGIHCVSGICAFAILTLVQWARVRSASRRLMRSQDTSMALGIDRIVDIDLTLDYISTNLSGLVLPVVTTFALKFGFGVVFSDTLQGQSIVEMVTLVICQPCWVILAFLGSSAVLNQSCDAMRTVVARFVVTKRGQPEEKSKPLFQYMKTCDLSLRAAGFKVTMNSAWKIVLLSSSATVALSRLSPS